MVLVSDELALDLCSRLREGEPGRSWDRDLPVIVSLAAGRRGRSCPRLRARVRRLRRAPVPLRRAGGAHPSRVAPSAARAGASAPGWRTEVDTATRRVMVGDERALPGKEYELLVKLAGDRTASSRRRMFEVWGFRSLAEHAPWTRSPPGCDGGWPGRTGCRTSRTLGASAIACSATSLARLWNRRSPSQRRPGPSRCSRLCFR